MGVGITSQEVLAMVAMESGASAPPAAGIRFRPFDGSERDYMRFVEISNGNYPENPYTVDEIRHDDATWNHDKYLKVRFMGEDAAGQIVGYGEYAHMPSQFHPDRYWIEVYVDVALQGRGIGSAIYGRVMEELRERNALAARAATNESKPQIVRFLTERGFGEVQRSWESRLDVRTFDFDAFAGAEPRAAEQGIVITTLAAEVARDPEALRRAYDLHMACNRDVPSVDPYTEPSYEDWMKRSIEGPDYLPQAWFLAKDGERWVAESALWKNSEHADVLQQGLTGVEREYRGKGIAMALKVRGLRFARENGYREIRTFNNTLNRPMLRINEAMGFKKQPAWIIFQKELRS